MVSGIYVQLFVSESVFVAGGGLQFSVIMQVRVVDAHKYLVTPILVEYTGCLYVYTFICGYVYKLFIIG